MKDIVRLNPSGGFEIYDNRKRKYVAVSFKEAVAKLFCCEGFCCNGKTYTIEDFLNTENPDTNNYITSGEVVVADGSGTLIVTLLDRTTVPINVTALLDDTTCCNSTFVLSDDILTITDDNGPLTVDLSALKSSLVDNEDGTYNLQDTAGNVIGDTITTCCPTITPIITDGNNIATITVNGTTSTIQESITELETTRPSSDLAWWNVQGEELQFTHEDGSTSTFCNGFNRVYITKACPGPGNNRDIMIREVNISGKDLEIISAPEHYTVTGSASQSNTNNIDITSVGQYPITTGLTLVINNRSACRNMKGVWFSKFKFLITQFSGHQLDLFLNGSLNGGAPVLIESVRYGLFTSTITDRRTDTITSDAENLVLIAPGGSGTLVLDFIADTTNASSETSLHLSSTIGARYLGSTT